MPSGFTLIELLFVIAVIAILTGLAVPSYEQYIEKAQAVEAFALAGGVELAVADSYHETGAAPDDRAACGLTPDPTDTHGRYVQSIGVSHGVIIVTFGEHAHAKLQHKSLQFTPYVSPDDDIVWQCQHGEINSGEVLMPGAIASGPVASIPDLVLPEYCRGNRVHTT